ncbi:hypothetical protein WN943_023072 [Citrus x changshan-huyou]
MYNLLCGYARSSKQCCFEGKHVTFGVIVVIFPPPQPLIFLSLLPLHLLCYRTTAASCSHPAPSFFFLAQPHLLRYRTTSASCYRTTSASCYRTTTASCSHPAQIYNGHDRWWNDLVVALQASKRLLVVACCCSSSDPSYHDCYLHYAAAVVVTVGNSHFEIVDKSSKEKNNATAKYTVGLVAIIHKNKHHITLRKY